MRKVFRKPIRKQNDKKKSIAKILDPFLKRSMVLSLTSKLSGACLHIGILYIYSVTFLIASLQFFKFDGEETIQS